MKTGCAQPSSSPASRLPGEVVLMVKGKVTHFEIPVDKMDRARKFYADVFG